MPSVYDLKPRFQALLRPLVGRLAGSGVTANQVTIVAVVLSVVGGVLIACYPTARWPLALMPVLLLVRMGLNAVDGMLAREFGQQSRLGAVLNELGDVLSDIALYLPLALVTPVQPVSMVIFVLLAVIVEFTGIVAVQIGNARAYDGPMGKSDRAFWIGLMATLLALGWFTAGWVKVYVWVLVGLSVLTVIKRAWRALNDQLKEERSENPVSDSESDSCPASNASPS